MITAPAGPVLEARVYSVPLRTRFRGIDVRDGVLVRGPAGWGEFSPFWDYDVAESRRLRCAVAEWNEKGRRTAEAVGFQLVGQHVVKGGRNTTTYHVYEQ